MSNCYEKFISWCVGRYLLGGTGILPVREHRVKACATNAKQHRRVSYALIDRMPQERRPVPPEFP